MKNENKQKEMNNQREQQNQVTNVKKCTTKATIRSKQPKQASKANNQNE
jgi:hypothetical protein